MILLRRLDGSSFVLNCALIETVEATPDTVIRLQSGKVYVVATPVDEVVEAAVAYQQRVGWHPAPPEPRHEPEAVS